MTKKLLNQTYYSFKNYQEKAKGLTVGQKNQIEKKWDIEHAYYSSTLEGSKIDKKEFERLGAKVN